MHINSYTYIKSCAVAGLATQVASGPVTLKRITFNVATEVSVGIIDGITGSTVNVGLIGGKTANNQQTQAYEYDIRLGTGLRVITTGVTTIKPDITVVWEI